MLTGSDNKAEKHSSWLERCIIPNSAMHMHQWVPTKANCMSNYDAPYSTKADVDNNLLHKVKKPQIVSNTTQHAELKQEALCAVLSMIPSQHAAVIHAARH